MPLKRTPTKNKKTDKVMSISAASTEKKQSSRSSDTQIQTDIILNKSASETDLAKTTTFQLTTPPDYISMRNKRCRDQMEDSLSTQLNDFKDEIRSLLTTFTSSQSTELKNLTAQLKEMQQSNRNIEMSVTFLASQNEEYRKQIAELELQSKKDRNQIVFLENKLEEMQTNSRKASFEIKNVPKLPNESKDDLIEMTFNLCNSIECSIQKPDINDIYRLKPKPGHSNNTPIIVELNSTILKNNLLKSAKLFNIRHKTSKLSTKHIGFKTQDNPIYVCEHLTPKSARLYFLARDLVKTSKYKFCWTAYGKVYVRENEHTNIIQIFNENQVHKLLSAPTHDIEGK